eukprot:TRINITY_DN1386_c0_g1_i4.p2 TRINITY_DN1386_c0_g1~~TRINITY_DN1386_c0_g1_i4.p2  ORF type:complete len:547 (+),score=207.24 TRINITY_DN1386_c0_g1_i4:52-1692(+)
MSTNPTAPAPTPSRRELLEQWRQEKQKEKVKATPMKAPKEKEDAIAEKISAPIPSIKRSASTARRDAETRMQLLMKWREEKKKQQQQQQQLQQQHHPREETHHNESSVHSDHNDHNDKNGRNDPTCSGHASQEAERHHPERPLLNRVLSMDTTVYAKMCEAMISETTKARKMMDEMLSDPTLPGIALSARYWVERAEYELQQGEVECSIKMLSRGVSYGAKPMRTLLKGFQKIISRLRISTSKDAENVLKEVQSLISTIQPEEEQEEHMNKMEEEHKSKFSEPPQRIPATPSRELAGCDDDSTKTPGTALKAPPRRVPVEEFEKEWKDQDKAEKEKVKEFDTDDSAFFEIRKIKNKQLADALGTDSVVTPLKGPRTVLTETAAKSMRKALAETQFNYIPLEALAELEEKIMDAPVSEQPLDVKIDLSFLEKKNEKGEDAEQTNINDVTPEDEFVENEKDNSPSDEEEGNEWENIKPEVKPFTPDTPPLGRFKDVIAISERKQRKAFMNEATHLMSQLSLSGTKESVSMTPVMRSYRLLQKELHKDH